MFQQLERFMVMITKYSFSCSKCGKEFQIFGHWYNQMLMEWFLDYKYMWHCILKHNHYKFSRKRLIYFFKIHISFIPLFVLQILDILTEPFMRL